MQPALRHRSYSYLISLIQHCRLAKLPHLSAAVQVDILKNAGILDEVEALMRVGRAAAGVVTD